MYATTTVTDIWEDLRCEMLGFIRKATRDYESAEDILQDVFVKIILNEEKIRESRNLKQYLYGIVRNTITDHFRKKRNHLPEDQLPELWTEEEERSLTERIAECCLRPMIEQLPEKYREVLMKSEIGGMPQHELAEEMNMGYSAVKSRVQRGRQKVKDLFFDCCRIGSDRYGNLMYMEPKKRC